MATQHNHRRGTRTSPIRTASALRPEILVITACLLAAGCGTNAPRQTTASPTIAARALAFSQCMRSHRVTDYPDPNANGQVKIASDSGINFSSPAFQAAQAACQKLQDGGPSPSGPTSTQILGKFLAFSKCMRAHGISDFPDPTTSPPPPAPGHTVSNNGVYLFIPITFDVNSPTYKSASAACSPHSG
jgi:hypothetical protein